VSSGTALKTDAPKEEDLEFYKEIEYGQTKNHHLP